MINPMNDTLLTCPKCGHAFGVSQALGEQLRSEIETRVAADYAHRLTCAVDAAEARARASLGLQLEDLQAQVSEQRLRVHQAEQQELELRRRTRNLEEERRTLELEIERRLEREREAVAARLRQESDEAQALKLREKEKQIEDLRKALEDASRKSRQGSQELQGEVLELDIEAALRHRFPQDTIGSVPRGTRGADLIQEVRDNAGRSCGLILWELKNTRHFQPAWIDKLKQDQRAAGAALAVLVSSALPDGVRGFDRLDGVWVVGLNAWLALASALREQLVQVTFARAASQGKREKIELLYTYLSGNEFRHRVEAIVEAFGAMHEQLHRERRAMERLWSEREKQIGRIMANTAGMYGDIRGLIGAGMPEIRQLAVEAMALQGDTE